MELSTPQILRKNLSIKSTNACLGVIATKVTYGSFTKSGALQKNEEPNTKKGCLLHSSPIFFEENFYLMKAKRRSRRPDRMLVSGARSTVAIKRLICSMRAHNYLKIVNSGFVRN